MAAIAKQIIFTGRVQGVGFRFTVFNIASVYNLTGIVRNLPNGSVEMVVQGPSKEIDSCLKDIKRSFSGYINDTAAEDIPQNLNYKDFKITF